MWPPRREHPPPRLGTAGVPEGVLLETDGISRDLTPSGLKTPAAPALKGRRSDEICQDLKDRRRDHTAEICASQIAVEARFCGPKPIDGAELFGEWRIYEKSGPKPHAASRKVGSKALAF